MKNINSFGFVGGDKRQLYCAESIAGDGFAVGLYGFDEDKLNCFPHLKLISKNDIMNYDAIIFPLPITHDGRKINTPLFSENLFLEEEFLSEIYQKPVFCGMKHKLPKEFSEKFTMLFDYSTREEFSVSNAVPTAEGAIQIAMTEYDGTINHSECLVTGYGRIGKVLSAMLKGLGAKVTVSARKLSDLEFIQAAGMKAVRTEEIPQKYDIIFNTVPELIFDAQTLARTASHALVIDLASLPGGIDDKAAERMSIPVIHALSLPGKCAPKAAGIIIKNAVYHTIREEKL